MNSNGRVGSKGEENMPKVAVVQRPPAVLDREASFRLAADAIAEAAAAGAKLVVFPETFIGGYPDWAWRLRPVDFKAAGEIHERLLGASVDLTKDGTSGNHITAAVPHQKVTRVGLSISGATLNAAHTKLTFFATVPAKTTGMVTVDLTLTP